jgi:hypothetical protein
MTHIRSCSFLIQLHHQQTHRSLTEWTVERHAKSSSNTSTQQTPSSLAHAVHLLQQAITHPLYQQSPPPELTGLVSLGRDNDFTTMNGNINEEQFERYARWLKQRREINNLRIKADETNLTDIKKKRNILLKKQKQVSNIRMPASSIEMRTSVVMRLSIEISIERCI